MKIRLVTLLSITAMAAHTHAATIVVTNTADSGAGSLRAAISSANATSEADTIAFNIPNTDPGFQTAAGHWRIDISSTALPPIENNLIIDGYSQPGALVNTNTPSQGGSNAVLKIELRNSTGSNAVNGIDGLSNNSNVLMVVRGLGIHSFQSQIQLAGGAPQRVEGCFLGTTIDGAADANPSNNNQSGVRVQGFGAFQIGGLTPDTRNVISGDANGVVFQSVANGVRIEGNLIGTDAAGTVGISPRATGITLNSSTNTRIGGTDPNARNLISGNGFWGLTAFNVGATNAVIGNIFGADWTGTRPVRNGSNPFSPTQIVENVRLSGVSCPLQFGGALPGEANLLAFSPLAGVGIDTCTNAVHRNRFLGNSLPIDNVSGGGFIGATPNDVGDPDTGGNRIQNFPVVSLPNGFLPAGGNSVNFSYVIDTLPANATYPITVEFYRGACGGGSSGVLLGSDSYVASNAGTSKNFTLTAADGANVLPLIAVAVDAAGNASEVSPMLGDAIFRQDFEDVLGSEAPGQCR
jgi:hypothetical protein